MPQANPNDGGQWGIMGGAFDPIHYGHLMLAESACQAFDLTGVLFVPSFNPPHRENQPYASFEDRYNMTGLAIKNNEKFVLSDIEKDIEGPGYTLKLIEELDNKYPDVQWRLILGADNIAIFNSWHKPQELIRRAGIIVGGRPGYDEGLENMKWSDKISRFNMPLIDISSTEIRKRIAGNKSIRYMLPETVRKYINDKGLYR